MRTLLYHKRLKIFCIIFLVIGLYSNKAFAASYPHPQIEKITNPLRTDGFGGQFYTIIITALFAELNGKKFTYTPFQKMAHNYNNDPLFLRKKEKLINFIGNFVANSDYAHRPNTEAQSFFENNLDLCTNSDILKKIKSIFRANKNRSNYFSSECINIAVHIRRPNSDDTMVNGTNIPDTVYLKTIDFLRNFYSSRKVIFHLYSQGDVNIFKKIFGSNDTIFHINQTIEDTFTALVLADVLITAPSAFSYTAGLLSEGDVYYIAPHPDLPYIPVPAGPPLPHWIPLNLDWAPGTENE